MFCIIDIVLKTVRSIRKKVEWTTLVSPDPTVSTHYPFSVAVPMALCSRSQTLREISMVCISVCVSVCKVDASPPTPTPTALQCLPRHLLLFVEKFLALFMGNVFCFWVDKNQKNRDQKHIYVYYMYLGLVFRVFALKSS